ncbi:MAG: DNA translocase FtsK 4TM domain-containing protein, partial [Lachnospiraceae bacterium]|nr:DNA translocase FtsK 4TM domain-containing protein [Lachnospiraceae bacterium]
MLLAFAVLVFLCNFGLIGAFGKVISGISFGLFGFPSYILPPALVAGGIYWQVSKNKQKAIKRLGGAFLLILCLGIAAEMLAKPAEVYSVSEIYKRCASTKEGGGVFFGSIAFLFLKLLSQVGTVLVLMVLGIISALLLTDKSLLEGVRHGGEFLFERAEESYETRDLRKEERRQRRLLMEEEREEKRLQKEERRREERARREEELRIKEEERLERQEQRRKREEAEGISSREEGSKQRGPLKSLTRVDILDYPYEGQNYEQEETRQGARRDNRISGVLFGENTVIPDKEELELAKNAREGMHEITLEDLSRYEEKAYSAGNAANVFRKSASSSDGTKAGKVSYGLPSRENREAQEADAEEIFPDRTVPIYRVPDIPSEADIELGVAPIEDIELGVTPIEDRELEVTPIDDMEMGISPIEEAERGVTEYERPGAPAMANGDLEMMPVEDADREIAEYDRPGAPAIANSELGVAPIEDRELGVTSIGDEELSVSPIEDMELGVSSIEDTEKGVTEYEKPGVPALANDELEIAPIEERELEIAPIEEVEQGLTEYERPGVPARIGEEWKEGNDLEEASERPETALLEGRSPLLLPWEEMPAEAKDGETQEDRRETPEFGNAAQGAGKEEWKPEREARTSENAVRDAEQEPEIEAQEAKKEADSVSNAEPEPKKEIYVKPRVAYERPPVSFLKAPKPVSGDSAEELWETARKLQQTLENFGVKVQVTDYSQGPSVTRFELQPEVGVKVSKIVGLTDDIKLNLAATDIRIEAPIPGKAAVGIEVPNKENMAVPLRELLESEEFAQAKSNLSFAVGKDIAGNVVIGDIAKMPHMLIAGSTGSGKSVCINTIIMSLLYKSSPEDVKLILIDPKVVELSIYNGIPHLMLPVVTDPKKATGALQWGVKEMMDRYKKFAQMGARDLKSYNQRTGENLPQIVIIVDELADLMMVASKDVEEAICRITQLARAAGIHLIIATQRPSVDVITGVIKANMPSRIA